MKAQVAQSLPEDYKNGFLLGLLLRVAAKETRGPGIVGARSISPP